MLPDFQRHNAVERAQRIIVRPANVMYTQIQAFRRELVPLRVSANVQSNYFTAVVTFQDGAKVSSSTSDLEDSHTPLEVEVLVHLHDPLRRSFEPVALHLLQECRVSKYGAVLRVLLVELDEQIYVVAYLIHSDL